ncbi:sigma-70 family RNA polymerase sigma factor [candidate division WOR-3 bacterium]|nr:sigma-70 family RNA polymerase sigma factor [candidate division WOR-3 bacterium]
MSTADAEAIRLTVTGDKEAFAVIVARYTERAYRMALYILGSEQDAMDVSQDAFIRAYRNLKRFDLARPFFPWFARILRNLCYNYYNRRKRRMTYDIENFQIALPSKGITPETRLALNKALSELSPQDREIIGKFYFEQLSYAEIAEELDIPIGTVMSRLYYARRHLKNFLLSARGVKQ